MLNQWLVLGWGLSQDATGNVDHPVQTPPACQHQLPSTALIVIDSWVAGGWVGRGSVWMRAAGVGEGYADLSVRV